MQKHNIDDLASKIESKMSGAEKKIAKTFEKILAEE